MKIHIYVLALLFVVHRAYQQALNCYVPADIMILIDGSDSIQDGDWRQVKSFVRQLVTNFDIGQDAIHVGFVVYSSAIGDHIGLKPFKAKNILQTLSGILKQPKASTNTAKGIEYVRKEFQEHGRPGVPKILIVITDGSSDNPRETRLQANLAKMEGTRVIAVGVGQTFRDELRQIASKPEKVYTAASFATLRTLVTEIRRMVCQVITTTTTTTTAIPIPTQPPVVIPVPTGKICDVPADIVFVVDGSQSIADADFVKLKNFVANLIDNFEIGARSIHVGVVTYSTLIGDVISLQPPKRKTLLKLLTRNLRHPKAGTNTARGIERARLMIQNEGIRADSPKIVVVITDGRSSSPSKTKTQADLAKAEGITMIAVGVGTQIFSDELQSIASSSRKVFEVSDFRSLELIITAMRDLICQVKSPVTTPKPEPPTTPPPYVPPPDGLLCDVPADVGFLLDGSDSIDPRDWTRQKNFVANLINNLNVGRETIHVGMTVFSTIIGDTIGFIPFKPKVLLMNMARNLKQPKVGTNTARGIQHMRGMLKSQGRPKAPKVMVIITDGKSSSPRKTIAEANLAKQDGITVIALGVGSQIFMDELRQIATNERKLFEVSDFSSLQQIIVALRDLICQVITTPAITTTTPMPPISTLPPIPGCEVPADIVMLMHGSKDISEDNWRHNKEFVGSLVRNLHIKKSAHNFGMIVYSMSIGDHIGLKPFKDPFALQNLANSLIHPGVGANTGAAIAKLREAYRDHGRAGAPKIGVIITDSRSNLPQETQVQADLAKTEGVKLITIGVGSNADKNELNNLATDARKVYNVNSFRQISSIMPDVRDMICEIIKTPVRPAHNFTDLCAGCLVDSNTGFNPFPGDCSKYVQCWKDFNEIRGMIKQCPFGQFWDREAITCRPSMNVKCPDDPCLQSPDGFTYGMVKYGCRSYWVCLTGISVGSCCPEGTYYLEGMGCMRGMACKTPCPPDGGLVVSPNCEKKKHWDERKYIQNVPSIGPVVRHCAPGTVFDTGYCSCVVGTSNYVPVTPQDQCRETVYFPFDVDMRDKSGKRTAVGMTNVRRTRHGTMHFNGNSQMNIWRLAGIEWGNKLVIRFKFKFDRWTNRFDYGGHAVDVDWTGDYQWKWDKDLGWRRNSTVGGGWDIVTLLRMFRNLYASTSEIQMERNMLKIAESPDFQMLLYHIGFVPEATNAMQILRMLISGQGSVFIRQILERIGNRQGAYEIRILLQRLLTIQGIQKWVRDHSGKHIDITMDRWRRFLSTLNITDARWSNDNGWIDTMGDKEFDIIAQMWWNFVREMGMTGPEWQQILKWSLGTSGKNGHLDKSWITEMLIAMKNDTIKNRWLDYLGRSNYSISWNNNRWVVSGGSGSGVTGKGWNKWLNWIIRIYYKDSGAGGVDTGTGGNDGSLDYWLHLLLSGGDVSGIGDGLGWGMSNGWNGWIDTMGNKELDTIAQLWWNFVRKMGMAGPEWQHILKWSLGKNGMNGHLDKSWITEMLIAMKNDTIKNRWLDYLGRSNYSISWNNNRWVVSGGSGSGVTGKGWNKWLNWIILIYYKTSGTGGVDTGTGGNDGSLDYWLYLLLSGGDVSGIGDGLGWGMLNGWNGQGTGDFGHSSSAGGGFDSWFGNSGSGTGGFFGGNTAGHSGGHGWYDTWMTGGSGRESGWFGTGGGSNTGGVGNGDWWFGANSWDGSTNNNGMSGNNMGGGSDLFGTGTNTGGSTGNFGGSTGTSIFGGSAGTESAVGTGGVVFDSSTGSSTGSDMAGGNGFGLQDGLFGSSAGSVGSSTGSSTDSSGAGGNGQVWQDGIFGSSMGSSTGSGGAGGNGLGMQDSSVVWSDGGAYGGLNGLFGGVTHEGAAGDSEIFNGFAGAQGTHAGATGAGGIYNNFGGSGGLYGGSAGFDGIYGSFAGDASGSNGAAAGAGGLYDGSLGRDSGMFGSFSEAGGSLYGNGMSTESGSMQTASAGTGAGGSYGKSDGAGGVAIGSGGLYNSGGGEGLKEGMLDLNIQGNQGSALGGDGTMLYAGNGYNDNTASSFGVSGQGAWSSSGVGLGSDWANQNWNYLKNVLGQDGKFMMTSQNFNNSVKGEQYILGTLQGNKGLFGIGTQSGSGRFGKRLKAGSSNFGGAWHGDNQGTVSKIASNAGFDSVAKTSGGRNVNNFVNSQSVSSVSSGTSSLGTTGKATSTNTIIDKESAANMGADGAAINIKPSIFSGFGGLLGSTSAGLGTSSSSQAAGSSAHTSGSSSGGASSAHTSSSSSGGASHEGLDTILSNLGGVANGHGGGSSSSSSIESGEVRLGGHSGGNLFPIGMSDADILEGLLIGSGELYRKKRETVARRKRAAANVNANQYQTLVSNCQGNSQEVPSISISANERNVKFQLKTTAAMNVAEMELPLVPNWNEVTLVYDGNNMHCRVKNWRGTQKNSIPLSGKIERRQGGLMIGSCGGRSNFKGEMDDLMVFNCLPSTFKQTPAK